MKPSSLGDIVLALPALSALRRNYPEAKITWLVRPEFSQILENHPHLTDIVLFDRKFLGKSWYKLRAFGAFISLIRQLRRSKFDIVIDLQGLFRTASLAWLSGCKRRFGMANAREFAHIFYTNKISQDQTNIHLVDYYLKIIQAVGACDIGVEFVFPEDAAAGEYVSRLLQSYGIKPHNYVVFIPGSAHVDKCWPADRFAALADKISSEFSLPIVAAGTESEKSIVKNIADSTKATITNFAGLTNLKELVVLLKTAKFVISNDTGPGHIAAALGVPMVLIFGWSNPFRIAPYGRSRCIAAGGLDSRGTKISSADPKHDVKAVTIDEVYKKVCEQFGHENSEV